MKSLARAGDKAEVLARLKALQSDSLRRWGRMSAHQVVCHLADCFRMATGEKATSPASGPLQRTLVKWVALYLPVRWPEGRIQTRPELDQAAGGGTCPTDFAADVADLERLIDRITGPARGLDGQLHPIFGRLSDTAWLRWGYLHVDHHLRQFGV